MLGIAFEGCACRAAFHAGVAAALSEAKLSFSLSAGASSGSLCAAAVAAEKGTQLPTMWRELAGRNVISLRRLLWNRSPFDMSHIVRNALRNNLGSLDLRTFPTEALIVATRLRKLDRIVYSSHQESDLIEPLMGSCFFPILYGRPVKVRNDWLLDGGAIDNMPVEILAERGVTDIVGVVTSHEGIVNKTPLRKRWRPSVHGAKLHIIKPSRPLAIKSWDFDVDHMNQAIDEGYRQGRLFVGQ
ncbi:MAG TPA: patatin-like phospholipase family protein [Pseudomonadota bacterium]|nr:patatin-like phospholipase family protein [Pseudomonadota bacterium]